MMSRFRVAVLSTGRQDFGILHSSLVLLRDSLDFELLLIAGGMHLKSRFGRTVEIVRANGFEPAAEVDFLAEPPDPPSDAARALIGISKVLRDLSPHALLLVGDRSETLAAGLAATLAAVPIAHLHGGEETEGAVDNAFRHALTKLSHLHLVSHPIYRKTVIQMGEPPDNVHVVGAPGIDNLYRTDLPSNDDLEKRLGLALSPPLVLVTVHPTTLEEDPLVEVSAVAATMERVPATYVVTRPNADEGGSRIREFWDKWVVGREAIVVVDALGEDSFWALLRRTAVVLGNGSSGMIEAPAAGARTVNVGDRQKGRLRFPTIVDVRPDPEAVTRALAAALAERAPVDPVESGFPSGPASHRIVAALRQWLPHATPRKQFHSVEPFRE